MHEIDKMRKIENSKIQSHTIHKITQRFPLGNIDDFRGEISLMGEIKGPLIFYWANFLY
jgi:hypothetical protein